MWAPVFWCIGGHRFENHAGVDGVGIVLSWGVCVIV